MKTNFYKAASVPLFLLFVGIGFSATRDIKDVVEIDKSTSDERQSMILKAASSTVVSGLLVWGAIALWNKK